MGEILRGWGRGLYFEWVRREKHVLTCDGIFKGGGLGEVSKRVKNGRN